MIPTKYCRGCEQTKSMGAFHINRLMRDGHLNRCRECVRAYQCARYRFKMATDPVWREKERARNREKYRKYYRSRRPRKDPVKLAAHHAVADAVKYGRLVPSQSCEDCGHDFSEFRREAHHPDYSNRLEVVWLCTSCHSERHRSIA